MRRGSCCHSSFAFVMLASPVICSLSSFVSHWMSYLQEYYAIGLSWQPQCSSGSSGFSHTSIPMVKNENVVTLVFPQKLALTIKRKDLRRKMVSESRVTSRHIFNRIWIYQNGGKIRSEQWLAVSFCVWSWSHLVMIEFDVIFIVRIVNIVVPSAVWGIVVNKSNCFTIGTAIDNGSRL